MLERPETRGAKSGAYFCNNCSHDWRPAVHVPQRFHSVDDLVARTGLRRDELVTLADIGALNSLGYDRRSALWQAERAVRPAGEMFEEQAGQIGWEEPEILAGLEPRTANPEPRTPNPEPATPNPEPFCPLRPMSESERLVADYAGTGMTIGRHPMALKRDDLALRGVLRAVDLRTTRHGRRVRVAGMVITRQRPGTAKGFVFLTLEDETGVANIIVRPDLFARERLSIVEEPFLLIDGFLQHQDDVVSVRAEAVQGLKSIPLDFDAHNFY
jgi:error-prone DNA polymerase